MNFDDIGSLLSDILDGKDPKPVAPTPAPKVVEQVVQATILPADEAMSDDDLGSLMANLMPQDNIFASVTGDTKPVVVAVDTTENVSTQMLSEFFDEVESVMQEAADTTKEVVGEIATLQPVVDIPFMGREATEQAIAPMSVGVNENTAAVFTDTAERDDEVAIPMPTFTSAEAAATMDLRNFATIVTLNTARWHAKVKDRQASRDAARVNEASEDAFETRKKLLAGADDLLKAIHKAIDAARAKHYELTLPWTTTGIQDIGRRSGGRLLPNSLFFDYTKAMATFKADMKAAVAAFVPAYPSLVEQAEKKLGKRFDRTEYPNAESIEQHFDLSFDFQPVPEGSDFKGLPQQQCDALANAIQSKTTTMVENAMQDLWTRLYEAVTHMSERLSHPDKMFHHTMVSNIANLAYLMKHLNVTGDRRMEELRQRVQKDLCRYDAEALRKDAACRRLVATAATEILAQMKGMAK